MNKKRFFNVFLCICLLIGLMPVTKSSATTNISSVSITVVEPVIGEKPSVTASVPDDAKYYVKEVSWGSVKTFHADTKYTVSILLAVKEGADAGFVKKANSDINAAVNGNQAEWYHSSYQPGKELYVKYTFPELKGAAAPKNSIAVSSAEDLLKMRDNLSGSYYLTKDITVPENTQIFDDFSNGAAFTGTLDGKGHKIKGYKVNTTASEYPRVSLFGFTKDATFKNLTLSGVDIKVKSDRGALVSALCNGSAKCSEVTITGKISVSGNEPVGDEGDYEIYGFCRTGTFKKCTNKAVITADCSGRISEGSYTTGIANYGTFKNCKNTGNISSKGTMQGSRTELGVAGISIRGTLTGCKNTGAIKAEGEADPVYAVGVSCEPDKIGNCSNTGKITVTNKSNETAHAAGVAVKIVVQDGKTCTKCFNTGTVSIRQKAGGFLCGGVFASAGGWVRECYNTGKVTVTSSKKVSKYLGEVGGVIGSAGRISECYNTGKISSNTICQIGGVAGVSDAMDDWTVIHCYNTGKVSDKRVRGYVGSLLGSYTNGRGTAIGKYYVYDNYSTVSPLYGPSMITWKPYRGRGKKVSSINAKNCPKLSSKYWTYSKKHKRLILKNVKEK